MSNSPCNVGGREDNGLLEARVSPDEHGGGDGVDKIAGLVGLGELNGGMDIVHGELDAGTGNRNGKLG